MPRGETAADKRRRKEKGRATKAPFIQIPHWVMETPDYLNLSHTSRSLLAEMVKLHNGRNNGDLSAAESVMKTRGFRSHSALRRALRQLVDSGLLVLTRQGHKRTCSLYALGWLPIDDIRGKRLDVQPTEKGSFVKPAFRESRHAAPHTLGVACTHRGNSATPHGGERHPQ